MALLAERLCRHARNAGLFREPGTVLLAVSGGPDSVCMLDLLKVVSGELGLDIVVAHVDHGISPDSARVASRVESLAARYVVPFLFRSLHLGAGASETRARHARYEALRAMQLESGAAYLATAHHADDQVETVLFRFLRGSGPAGLAGIAARGPGGLVRPLLPFTRRELAEWLETRYPDPQLRPDVHRDPANSDERHDRSWIRQELLPILRRRFGDTIDRTLDMARRHAESDRDAWSGLLGQLTELDFRKNDKGVNVARGPLRTYDKTLSHAVLRAIGREAGCIMSAERAERLEELTRVGQSGRSLELGSGWTASLVFERLHIERQEAPQHPASVPVDPAGGRVSWGEWILEWRQEPAGTAVRSGTTTWVTAERSEIRAVQSGDRFFPLGGVGSRPVRRLLMEARVPRNERPAYPVLVMGSELLWLPGVCRAAGRLPSPGTRALRFDARRA